MSGRHSPGVLSQVQYQEGFDGGGGGEGVRLVEVGAPYVGVCGCHIR